MKQKPRKRTVTDAKRELAHLTEYFWIAQHPKVQAAVKEVCDLNAPRVAELRQEIEGLKTKRKPAPRPGHAAGRIE